MPGIFKVSVMVVDEDTNEKREARDLTIVKSLDKDLRVRVLSTAIAGLFDKLEPAKK